MAGAIAYRLFIWLLPASLVVVSLAGFLRDSQYDPESAAHALGISAYVAADVAEQSHHGRWGSLVFGLFALALAGADAGRTLQTIHQLAWGIDPELAPAPEPTARGQLPPSGAGWRDRHGARVVGAAQDRRARDCSPRSSRAWRSARCGSGSRCACPTPMRRAAHAPSLERCSSRPGPEFLHVFAVYYLVRKLPQPGRVDSTAHSAARLPILLWLYMIGLLLVASPVLEHDPVAQPGRPDPHPPGMKTASFCPPGSSPERTISASTERSDPASPERSDPASTERSDRRAQSEATQQAQCACSAEERGGTKPDGRETGANEPDSRDSRKGRTMRRAILLTGRRVRALWARRRLWRRLRRRLRAERRLQPEGLPRPVGAEPQGRQHHRRRTQLARVGSGRREDRRRDARRLGVRRRQTDAQALEDALTALGTAIAQISSNGLAPITDAASKVQSSADTLVETLQSETCSSWANPAGRTM